MDPLSETWKLLLLEDDDQLREVLASVLQDEGYKVVAVDNGAAAVEMAARESFDLIITDIRMHGLDGLEALEGARRHQPELSSLVVSGYASEAETLRALQLNVGGFLKKPVALGDLLKRVRELLLERRQQLAQRDSLQALRNSLWWALQSSASSHREAGTLALYLAQQMGMSDEEAQRCRLAAMLTLQGTGWPSFAARDQLGLGPIAALCQEMRKASQSTDNPTPPSIAAQVALLASSRSEEGTQEEPAFAWDPGLQAVLAAEGEQWRDSPRILASEAAQEHALGFIESQRGMLALALTLEERSDWKAARTAYTELARDPSTKLPALVGMARVLFAQSDGSWVGVLKEAEILSRSIGPLLGANQRWPIAALLLRARHPSADTYLGRLEQELEGLGLQAAWARSRVARAWLAPDASTERLEEAIQVLAAPSRLGDVAPEASWLVPALLDQASQLGLPGGIWCCRLASEFPAVIRRWALHQDSPGLQLLLTSMEAHPEQTVQSLLTALAHHPSESVRQRLQALRGEESPGVFLRLRSFGCFEVFVDGERVPDTQFKSHKYKFILAYLAARRGQSIPEEVLVEEFWPDARGTSKGSVYAATTTLRRCLRGSSGTTRSTEFILREGDRLTLNAAVPCWHDLEEFEQACQEDSLTSARQAATLLTGPYLQGCYLDWAERKRQQIDEQAVRLFTRLAQSCQEAKPQEALDYSQKGLELEPTAQECHLIRMQVFLKLGQPEKAIKQYQQCQQVLHRDLGIEPLTSVIEVYYRAQLALP